MNPLVVQIAHEARSWLERSNRRRVRKFPADLAGMCAIASARLYTKLQEAGFNDARIVYNADHVYVLRRGWIIDLTASQFGLERVLICKPDDPRVKGRQWWARRATFKSAAALRLHQQVRRWPEEQIAAGIVGEHP